eukprot:GILK01005750.1.p1 GENE.GILK01005750.1~~GILK01005750.1.p1  ORF type:complete len:424 (+),score=54.88 GILK01005750.1:45-1316(+)
MASSSSRRVCLPGDVVPHNCLHVDASWGQILKMLTRAATPLQRNQIIAALEKLWVPGRALACLSVRTGLDLWLQVKRYPLGTEVIMTAINIPDMPAVLRAHGILPVPVDIDFDTLAPAVEDIERLITPNTKILLLAHIYGTRFCMDPYVALAKKYKLDLIEDVAEGFDGLDYIGHPDSDLSLFSFGTIKVATAFGGGMATVRDAETLARMRSLNMRYPIQSRASYAKKVLKNIPLTVVLNEKISPRILIPSSLFFGFDHKALVVSLIRGFDPSADLSEKFRFQPSTPLLSILLYRLKTFNRQEFLQGTVKGQYMQSLLPKNITVPGMAADLRNFWLYPICVENRDAVLRQLNMRGVDAYVGATQLKLVEPPGYGSYPQPVNAKRIMDTVIYLPVHGGVEKIYLEKMGSMLCEITNSTAPKSKL